MSSITNRQSDVLPSWIPHVSGASFSFRKVEKVYSRVGADLLVGKPGSRTYNACGKTRAYFSCKTITVDKMLVTHGFVLDTICDYEPRALGGVIPSSWLDLAGSDPQSLYRHRPREKPAWPAESLLA